MNCYATWCEYYKYKDCGMNGCLAYLLKNKGNHKKFGGMKMDKYINADRVKEKCAESCKYVRVGNEEYLSVGDVCRIVDEIPSADVIEVVRCKDCKHIDWETAEPIISNGIASVTCWCNSFQQYVRVDDFCSYGERKDDNA